MGSKKSNLDMAIAAIDRFNSPDRRASISLADLRAIVEHIGTGPTPIWMPSLQPKHEGCDAPRFDRGGEQ